MRSIAGERVFFKRRGWRLLRAYWCQRWDNVRIREALSRDYEPKYWVDREALDGYFVVLERLEFLWYRGLFSVGRHVASGRYVRDPVHLPIRGLGPRELVFPISLTEQLDRLTLLGGWKRYALSAGLKLEADDRIDRDRESERVVLAARRVEFTYAPALLGRWGELPVGRTLCLVGRALAGRLAGRELTVPLRELKWSELAGYRERYFAPG